MEETVRKQIEYYFSDSNMPTAKYLLGLLKEDGWVDVGELLKVTKVGTLSLEPASIADACRGSTSVEVSDDGRRVRRREQLDVIRAIKRRRGREILVTGFGEGVTVEKLKEVFGGVMTGEAKE